MYDKGALQVIVDGMLKVVRHGLELSWTLSFFYAFSVFFLGFSMPGFRFGKFRFPHDGMIVDGMSPGRVGLQ